MTTPIIPGFYPDPSVCRVGDTYYTAHSSFEYAPGVPVFRSTDLVTWTQVGNALTRPSQLTPSAGAANSGIYAPSIRYGQGKFWIVTTNIGEIRRGHLIVSAEDPAGPWSDAVFVPGAMGIDPDLMWDDDGVCRLTWASFDPACPGIVSAPIDPERGQLLGEPQQLWPGTGLQSPEGPHLYRIDGWWYLLIAEGGTERGHTVAMARARDLGGPWETPARNPIFTHRSTSHPVQNVGHADLVEVVDGSWGMVYHGVRPRGISPHFHVNGRETFVAGIDWVDGWPVVDEDRFHVDAADHSFVDRFGAAELDPRWIAPGAAPSTFSTSTPEGLLIESDRAAAGGPAVLAVRARDEEWSFRVRISTRGLTRVLVRMDPSHWYGLSVDDEGIEATLAIGPAVSTLGRIPRPASGEADIRIRTTPAKVGAFGAPDAPDLIELSAADQDGSTYLFGAFDGRYLSTEVAGRFTGRVVGVEVVTGSALVKEAEYRSGNESSDSSPGGARYDLGAAKLETLLEDVESRAIFDELVPELTAHPFLEHMKAMPVEAILGSGNTLSPAVVDELRVRLSALRRR